MKNKGKKRAPADVKRIRAILVGPVYHDQLYIGGDFDEQFNYSEAPLQRRNPHKMPRNVAPLVCKIDK